ncbi:MAG: hypothetical protein E6Q73_12570 [Pseudorhodobacter sp.]|nr:MAG: hypothetical protein E6Q73_12570 [Pseudorhodobacter sp.]
MPVTGFSEIGDRLTEALVKGDFGLYQTVMELPLTVVPLGEAPYVLADEPALRRDFELYHNVLKLHGVTDIFREVRAVFDDDDDVHRILCRVHIMAHANRIAEPFLSEMRIRPRAGLWRIIEIRSLAAHIGWTLGDNASAENFLKR